MDYFGLLLIAVLCFVIGAWFYDAGDRPVGYSGRGFSINTAASVFFVLIGIVILILIFMF